MRMAALSRTSGVPVPTIKFYLREGLLPPGRRTSPNQSQYDDQHVHRLNLIRGLTEIGGVSLARVGQILRMVGDPDFPVAQVFGVVAAATNHVLADRRVAGLQPHYDQLDLVISEHGWEHELNADHRQAAGMLLAIMSDLRVSPSASALQTYADAAQTAAQADVSAFMRTPTREQLAESIATAVILGDALATTLRRMAQTSLTVDATAAQSATIQRNPYGGSQRLPSSP